MGDLSRYSDEDIINIVSSDAEAELQKRGYAYGWYKVEPFVGAIYILVNPAFPNLVKIGYADDVQKRVKTLNSNSGLPDPYHVYALYMVKKRLEDLRLHELIDTLDSSLRHSKNREFYEMDAEKAFSILSAIAQINGDERQLVKNPLNDEYFKKLKTINQDNLSGIRLVVDSRDKTNNKDGGVMNIAQNIIIPDGIYYFKHKKKVENKIIEATASVKDGVWTLLKGSFLGMVEQSGMPQNAKDFRKSLILDSGGKLLKDVRIGMCSPSFIGALIMNKSCNGWAYWFTKDGQPIDIYRNGNYCILNK